MAAQKILKSSTKTERLPLPPEANELALPSGEHKALATAKKLDLIGEGATTTRKAIQRTIKN